MALLIPILLALVALSAGCAKKQLPEKDSSAAQLYVQRCAQCHAAYYPGSLTADMWRVQVPAMEDKMRQSGLPPLSDQDRAAILDYLTRNAGG